MISLGSWSEEDSDVSWRPSESVKASRIIGVLVLGLFLENEEVEDA